MQQQNSSSDYETYLVKLTDDITKFFLIASSVIGIPGNLLSIVIYLRLNRYTKTNMPFLFILQSLIDLILLTMTLLIFRGSFLLFGTSLSFVSNPLCKLWSFFNRYLLHISSWMLVLTTFDRFLFVIYEKRVKFMKDKMILTAIVLIMFILIAIADIENLLYFLTSSGFCTGNVDVRKSANIISSLLSFYIPMFLMVIFNSVIICKLIKPSKETSRQAILSIKERRFTIFVISFDTIFFISKAPLSIFYIIYYINLDSGEFKVNYTFDLILILTFNIILNISYFVQIFSFFISIAFNKGFRREFVRFLKRQPPRSTPRVSFVEPIIIRF